MATLTTCAVSLRPSSASIVTVAGWPSRTLPTSDSLSATTSCIEERSLSTAKEARGAGARPRGARAGGARCRGGGPESRCGGGADRSRRSPPRCAGGGLGGAAGGDGFANLASERDDRAGLGRKELGVGERLFGALHGQSVALYGARAEAMFASRSAGLRVALGVVAVFSVVVRVASTSARGRRARGRAWAGLTGLGRVSGWSCSGWSSLGCMPPCWLSWLRRKRSLCRLPWRPEPPAELSPSVSSSCTRLASAACRLARACSRVTSALVGVQFGEQLTLGDVLALGDVDLGDHAGGLEAEVELAGGLDIAAAGDGRLHDALANGDRAAWWPGVPEAGPTTQHGGDDRPHAERPQHVAGPRPRVAWTHCLILWRGHKRARRKAASA